jgi:DNA mismatch endonuclease (patch repair protein)
VFLASFRHSRAITNLIPVPARAIEPRRGQVARRRPRVTPSYSGLSPSSAKASAAARGASKKKDTLPEVQFRRLLHRAGLRFRKNVKSLSGCPDIVFPRARVAVFCDGDFWHGRNWTVRKAKLRRGANATYWILKIESNIERDLKNQLLLESAGWQVLRFWESEILNKGPEIVGEIAAAIDGIE